jgi:PHP family Zn ribbon phosphoesterase
MGTTFLETMIYTTAKCSQCDRVYRNPDEKAEKKICPTCQRLIDLGLEEEK